MASINQDPKSQVFRIRFRFGSVRVNRSLKTKDRKIAQSVLGRVEETLRLVEHGRLEIPPKVDPATFILRDGRIKPVGPQKQSVTLKQLFKIYQERLPATAKAPTTIALEMTHIKNFLRLLAPNKNANLIGQSDLQRYVEARHKEKWGGRFIGPETIRREVSTFRTVWNWAKEEYVEGNSPSQGLVYGKADAKQKRASCIHWKNLRKQ